MTDNPCGSPNAYLHVVCPLNFGRYKALELVFFFEVVDPINFNCPKLGQNDEFSILVYERLFTWVNVWDTILSSYSLLVTVT